MEAEHTSEQAQEIRGWIVQKLDPENLTELPTGQEIFSGMISINFDSKRYVHIF